MKIILSVKFSSWISYSCLIVSYGNISRSIVSLWHLALKEWIVRRTDSRSAIKTLVTHLNTHVPQIQAGESGELCYRFLPFLSVCTNKHHLKSPVTFMFSLRSIRCVCCHVSCLVTIYGSFHITGFFMYLFKIVKCIQKCFKY